MRGLAVAVLALALLLPGCATQPGAKVETASGDAGPLDKLTEDVYVAGDFLAQSVPSFDGVAIHVDLQLPNGTGPFPVLVQYTPYSNNLNANDEAYGATHQVGVTKLSSSLADFYVPKGYAVAIAHVRGSGQSGGCFTTGGPEEAKDGYAVVEWLANQSWSNGKVAMMGTSYVGTTPISTATLDPPHLTTIVPVSAVSDWYRYYFENGEPRFFGELPFGVVYTDQPLWMGMGFLPKPRNPTGTSPDQPMCAKAQSDNAYLQDDDNAYWMDRNYVKNLVNATAPMLYAHGFLDENTPTSLVTDFYGAYPAQKRLWLEQHGHGVPASFKQYHEAVHRWLDFYMLGRHNGALGMPNVTIEDNRGKYRVEAAWPPLDATLATFHLGEGKLLAAAPADGKVSYTDSPRALPQAPPAARGSFVQFDGDPLAADLHLSGAARVELVASSDKTDTQFDAQLFDVAPDGTATFITRGYLDARHRVSMAKGVDVVPGEEALYAFPMHGRDHHLDKGHALRLVIASTDTYVVPDAPGATNTLRLGPQGSRLVLPVIDGSSRTFTEVPWEPDSLGQR